MYGSTPTTTMPWPSSNGCPYCGCICNGQGTGCFSTGGGNWNLFVLDPEPRRRLRPWARETFTRLGAIPQWLIGLRQIPRRMKRPFTRNIEGPRRCHFNSRPAHRRLMRIRRQWRHRSSWPSMATAARSTPQSRTGQHAGHVTVRSLLA